MPHKIRVQKKKEAMPLRLVSRSEEMIDQVRAHPKWIGLGAGAVFLVIVLVLLFQFLGRRAEDRAWALEAEAFELFHEPPPLPQPIEEGKEPPKELTKTERLEKSAGLYDRIVEEYPRTGTAMVALYESGNVYYELENYDLAEKRYRSFLEKYADKKDLAALVHLKLGYLQQTKGDQAAALSEFRAAYEGEGGLNRDHAGFELARLLEREGKKDEAVEIYKKISENFSESPWTAEAKARLIVLDPQAASAPPPPAESEPGKETPSSETKVSPETPKK